MILKTFFNNKKPLFQDLIIKKSLNNNLYGKFFVRSSLEDSKSIRLIDNNSSFFNVSTNNLLKIIVNPRKTIEDGYSLNAKNFLYKNKQSNALRFRSFISNFTSRNNLLNSVLYSLKSLKPMNENLTNSLIVLKPIKGGFACYSSGIVGFLPRSHGLFFIIRTFFLLIKNLNNKSKLLNLNSIFIDENFNKKFFVFRLPFELGKITIYSRFKKNNFSLSSRKKKREFLNDYNFVFLSQKIEKKYNKNKSLLDAKTKKITKK
jgi:hypothetical protein